MDALLPWASRRADRAAAVFAGVKAHPSGKRAVLRSGRLVDAGRRSRSVRRRSALSRSTAARGSPVRRPALHSIRTDLLKPGMTGCSVFSRLCPGLPVVSVFA
jgi:hypothetical protein